jgi:hypothetical protein
MTRGSEFAALAMERDHTTINAESGQRLFLDVLDRGSASSIHIQLGAAERGRYSVRVIEGEASLDPQALPCLRHHLVRGRATLPGAFALERFVNAIDASSKGAKTVIERARFSRFVRFGDRDDSFTVRWAPDPSGGWKARLEGDIVHRSGHVLERDVRFCEARLHVDDQHDDEGPRINLSRARRPAYDPYCKPSSGADDHGVTLEGPFACLSNIEIGEDGRQAVFTAPIEHLDCVGESLPALLIDATWRLAAMHPQGTADTLYVPVSVERVTVASGASDAAGPLLIRAVAPTVHGDELRCSYAEVVDQNGRVRLRVQDAIARRVS